MYTVDVYNKGTGIYNIKARENEMAIEPMGKGFAPAEVLLASLGSCIGFFLRRYADQAKLELPEFGVRLASDWSQEKPMALRRIIVQIDLKGAVIDPKRNEAMLAFIKNCPVKATLDVKPEIEITVS
jgi:putative redox protein